MKEWFFFDRIDMNRARVRVDKSIVFAIPVLADTAESALPLGDNALMGAEQAAYFAAAEFLKKTRFMRFDEPSRRGRRFGAFY
jgi:hypothetical protein